MTPTSLVEEATLQRQGWNELRRRAGRGIYFHLPLWLLICGYGDLYTTAPRFVAFNASIFAASMLIRLWQSRTVEAGPVPFVFLTLLLGNSLHWGVVSAVVLVRPDFEAASWPIWLAASSVAAAGTMGLAIRHSVRWGYPVVAFLPVTLCLLATPTVHHLLLAVTAILGCVYLVGASRVVHDDYWAAARSRLELEASRRRFELLSFTDALTQVPNRLFFEHSLLREWQRSLRARSDLSVLLIDIDHFKRVNDLHGHAAGDAALQAVAAALEAGLKRGDDLIARYGGEEFIVLLPGTGAAAALEMAERLRGCVAALKLSHAGRPMRLSCSVGVASARPGTHGDAQTSPEATIAAADEALYRAKADGRNRVAAAGETVAG